MVINLGPLLSDSNTGGFTRAIKDDNLIFLGHEYCQIREKKYENTHFLPILGKIVEELKKDSKAYSLPRVQSQAKIQVSFPTLNYL